MGFVSTKRAGCVKNDAMNVKLGLGIVLVLLVCLFSGRSLKAAEESDIGTHAFFKLMKGKWRAEGELKGADGNVQKYKAEWTAAMGDDGSFVIEGTREIGDSTQQYRWIYSAGSAAGLFEATHEIDGDSGNAQRFEVSSSEAALNVEMSAFLSSGSAKVSVKETFVDEAHDKLQTVVEITDDQGNVTLTGTINNERQKSP